MPRSGAPHPDRPRFSLLSAADRATLTAGRAEGGRWHGVADAYPLSTLQSGVVFEAVRGGTPGLYHDVLTYRLRGRLDVPAFTRAVAELVTRHPVFRTSFHLEGFSEPVQVVHATAPPPLRVTDLRSLPAAERAARLAAAAAADRAAGFRYGTADLVRIAVHLLTDDEYQYTLSYHDAAIDSASVAVINHDLFETYLRCTVDGAGGRGPDRPVEPDPPGAGYAEFVAAERAARESAEQAAFWLETLDGAEGTRIPRYGDVPAGAPDGLGVHEVDLPAGLATAVAATAATLSVPVATMLAAAHVKVLSYLSGSPDVLTGYEHSGRPDGPAGERIAGLFLNTLPLRVDCAAGSWRDLVATVHSARTSVHPRRRFPMAEVKRRLGVRGLLVETVLNITPARAFADLSRRYGFTLPPADLNARTEFPLRAEFVHDPDTDGLRLSLHHHSAVFSDAQVTRIGGYYVAALRRLTADPDARHDMVSLMGEEETRLVAHRFAGPDRPLPAGTVADLFRRAAATWPDRVALVHGGHRMDYAELLAAATDLGARLRARGFAPGDACGVALPRGVPWATAALAVLLEGGVYVPLDPAHPPARIAAAATRGGAVLVVTATDSRAAIASALAARPDIGHCRVLDHEDLRRTALRESPTGTTVTSGPATAPAPGDDAYILFTSGSTGAPKGARITHAGMLNHLLAKVDELGLGPDDAVAQTASQSFDISVWQLLAAWLVGGRTVIYGADEVTDAPSFLDRIDAEGVTVVELVPSYLDALLTENARRPRLLPALRFGMVTGEAAPVPLVRRWFDQFDVPLVNAYGPTETADDVTHLVLRGPVDGARVPVGHALPNTGIHVVAPDGTHRPIGCYGEIVVTGVGVGRGYVNDPVRTARAFLPNVLDGRSTLMYRTGDVGRWLPGGDLDCAGRLDHQVKVRGFRIELSEVEGALAELPGIDNAVVAVTGAGSARRLVAVCAGGRVPESREVRRLLTRILPDYMLPDTVVTVERFPLTGNGKVDRAAVARLVDTVDTVDTADAVGTLGAPDTAGGTGIPGTNGGPDPATERSRNDSPPWTASELYVAGLFAAALDQAVERIGRDADFFDVGGHSLAAMKVAARSDGRLALRDIVTAPTVRSLAALLDAAERPPRPLLMRLTDPAPGAPALVCLPYAGGGAVNFLPLARQLTRRAPRLCVYGVEPPGRTVNDPLPASFGFDKMLETLADTLAAEKHQWVAVFGHCSGSVLALRLATLLAGRGVTVPRVFAAGKVLPTTDPDDYAEDEFATRTDAEVADWLRTTIGVVEVDQMTAAELADLAQAFRLDSLEATRMLHAALLDPAGLRLSCAFTQVVALDDALTAGHAEAVGHWRVFAPEVTEATLADGGHYFNRTRPRELAEVITTVLLA